MPLIHLVRHAEPAGSWGSHPDPGLSELGRAQARAVVRTLAGLSPRATVSSPLLRCQETAAPFAVVAGLAPRIEPRVAEISASPDDPDPRARLMALLEGTWSGSELAGWRAGVGAALLELEHDTVVFSHFVAINAAVSLAMGADAVTVFKPGHASVTTLEAGPAGLRLVRLGDEAAIALT